MGGQPVPKEPNWKLESLAVSDIQRQQRFQMRVAGTDPKHVQRLVGELESLEGGDTIEPVKVGKVGKAYYLLDGFHRLEAHDIVGASHVTAKVAKMALQDALDYAALSNLKHGKAPTRADKQAAWAKYIAAGRYLYADDNEGPLMLTGTPKRASVIARELRGMYTAKQVRTKQRQEGLLDIPVEFPHGYKPFMGGDIEEDEEEAAVDHEIMEEALAALWRFESRYQALEAAEQQSLLGTVREIVEALESGKRPVREAVVQAEPVLDI